MPDIETEEQPKMEPAPRRISPLSAKREAQLAARRAAEEHPAPRPTTIGTTRTVYRGSPQRSMTRLSAKALAKRNAEPEHQVPATEYDTDYERRTRNQRIYNGSQSTS